MLFKFVHLTPQDGLVLTEQLTEQLALSLAWWQIQLWKDRSCTYKHVAVFINVYLQMFNGMLFKNYILPLLWSSAAGREYSDLCSFLYFKLSIEHS